MRNALSWIVIFLLVGTAPAMATPLDPIRTRAKPEPDAARPLSARDVGLYRRIFAHQEAGHWDHADVLVGRLKDRLLLGHVLQQRYMHPDAYRSTFEELSTWLDQYGDHPGANRVYRLALKRRPADAEAPPRPVPGYLGGSGQERQEVTEIAYRSARERSPEEQKLVGAWREGIEKLARIRQPEAAFEQLKAVHVRRLLDRTEVDIARWEIARSYFALGDDVAALKLARLAAVRSGDVAPEMHWTAGIAAWRHGRIDLATRHFRALALAEAAHPSERARAAFWAARAYVVAQKPQEVSRFLRIAAEDGRSFYGQLARAVLGEQPQTARCPMASCRMIRWRRSARWQACVGRWRSTRSAKGIWRSRRSARSPHGPTPV